MIFLDRLFYKFYIEFINLLEILFLSIYIGLSLYLIWFIGYYMGHISCNINWSLK